MSSQSPAPADLLQEMNDRSREVFRRVVEGYLASGDPVGSRTLTRDFSEKVSAATIRNVMQDLEYMGVLGSPHISAGRIPTELGLRMFVDGMIELGDPTEVDRERIDATLGDNALTSAGKKIEALNSFEGEEIPRLARGIPRLACGIPQYYIIKQC